MSSKIGNRGRGTAAWRISLWGSIAFAIGTAVAFWFLQSFLAEEIQNRADSWLTGELGVLADVAERTPADRLHDTVVREVAELASREVPRDEAASGAMDRAVFFLQMTPDGDLKLHTGAASGPVTANGIAHSDLTPQHPAYVAIQGFSVPFRVAEARLTTGDRIYLALSGEHERKVLHRLRFEFTVLWITIIAFGSLIIFVSTRRMLHRVQVITDTAETIGRTNLTSRVPVSASNDEISRLSSTLNRMLDRVESSVQQLHAMSDALAHDLRSPLTSLRGKLELALLSGDDAERDTSIGQCIEQVDRLCSLLTTSLDVSEASVDALRVRKEPLDLTDTLESLTLLYEPAFTQSGLTLQIRSAGKAHILADPALMQRTLSNLLDNELNHLAPGHSVVFSIEQDQTDVRLVIEDDGDGFPPDLLPRAFSRYAKGPNSSGYGLGLAFVSAVIRNHDGSVAIENRPGGGARIRISLPNMLQRELTAIEL
jgi:signal transduction histidine kinase